MKKLILPFILAIGLFVYCIVTLMHKAHIKPVQESLTLGKAGTHQLSPEEYADGSIRFDDVQRRITPLLKKQLSKQGFTLGSPVFLRSFKDERILEMWMLDDKTDRFRHLQTWKIKGVSGKLGPKLKEGDKQSPEGFYHVKIDQFLPSSTNHLAFNVGYPNSYDRSMQRTGSFIMIHGKSGSVGCLAMTDAYIEEIYTLCHAALTSGRQTQFQVQMLPFRLTNENINLHSSSNWIDFWRNLQSGYNYFETHRIPPNITVKNKAYYLSDSES